MHWGFTLLLFVNFLVKASVQSCLSLDSHFYRPSLQDFRKYTKRFYIQCQNVTLSSDFHTKISSISEGIQMDWLEINNTYSPEIASGAFKSLHNIPDIRINGANVQVIQTGAFDGLFNLTQLSLKDNKINDLNGNCFSNLTTLERLDLSFNNLVNINVKSFTGLGNLKYLILENNFITEMPPHLFENLTNLQVLDLSFNKIHTLDDNLFKNLTKLVSLLLHNNNLNQFSNSLVCHNLRMTGLSLNNNYLSTLNNLSFPNALLVMNVSYNLVQTFNFANFTDIKIIDLRDNGISSLKAISFKNLAVQELYLDQNYLGLNVIENKIFSTLISLQIVSLTNNKIQQLHPDLFKFNTKLRKLNISQNYLTQSNFSNFPVSLQELDLSSNNFNTDLNLSQLTNLKLLDISFNELTQVSFHFFGGLKILTKLYLQSNQICKISVGAFRDLKLLRELNLANNNISELEIGVFVGLNILSNLDLSHNKLNVLSADIFHNLKNVMILDLSYNNFSFFSIEKVLSHTPWLRKIGLAGNRWSCSLLIDIIKEFRRIKIEEGNDFNITNVNGIACLYYTDIKNTTQNNDLEIYSFNSLAHKMTINNTLLILIFIVILIKLTLKYLPGNLKKFRISREKSEQEMQLI